MHLCRNTRCVWAGGGKRSQALGWAGPQGDLENPCKPHPPVEPALYHRGFPTVAGEGWARDLANQPPRLDWVAPQIAC